MTRVAVFPRRQQDRPSGEKRDIGGASETEVLGKSNTCDADEDAATNFDQGGDYEVLW